jgi:hypothetical protein
VEGVQNIRAAIFSHFSNHFKGPLVDRPGVEELNFMMISHAQAGNLIHPFTLEEVKCAVWNCDSFKNPDLDDISFGFLKDFWHRVKDDFMRFISKFHHNSKLSKGINSNFISLIPKVESPQRLNDCKPISLVG